MPSDQEIIDQATKLGELIAEHDAAKQMASASKAFDADPASQRAVTDYQRFAQALQQKAQAGQPIEVEDKRKLNELQQAFMNNPLLSNMQRAEMDYVDLLRKVDAAIVGAGGVAAPQTDPGAAGAGPLGGLTG